MNKAITDGVVLMPPAFAGGLDVWSSGDGTPGSDTYDNALNAAFVPADQDFGGALELQKVESVQRLRYMGETPLLPGCYLRVSARVKAISGNLPGIRIAAWAGGAGGAHVPGLTETGPGVTLSQYGEVVEVSAIIGAGLRTGVDMVWGPEPLYGHFGLDLTGSNGGVVRIDDIVIEDVTSVFLREMMPWVDVRDYGALGDGVTDDRDAFEAADAAANGRRVLVSKGVYFLGQSVTFESRVQFEGTVVMPDAAILSLTKDFDLPSYIDAFGNEELAFKKAFQALLNNSDHEGLDMGGRRITVSEPIDMQAAVANHTTFAQRRHIRNGQLDAASGPAWDTEVVTSQASYAASNGKVLTGVVNVANIPVGSLVEGNGVGREVYVRAKNVAAQEVTLSQELFDAEGTQNFTFRRFKYILDFSGFEHLSKLSISDVEFQCSGVASGILLAPTGLIFQLRDCFVTRAKDRCISSHGEGCQGMLIDRCQFISDEGSMLSQDRVSIVLNTNGNDVKLRNNRAAKFRHFAILGGTGTIVSGNHFFQGDGASNGIRTAGIVFARTNTRSVLDGNYVDNCFVEWTNEYDNHPAFASELSFSALTISDNYFLCSHVAPWFSFIVAKPRGDEHFINGMTVSGNHFRTIGGNIERVERVDTSFADFNYDRMKNITFNANMYNLVDISTENPRVIKHVQPTEAQTWVIEGAPALPFGGFARTLESVQPIGALRNSANVARHEQPYANLKQGPNNDRVELVFDQAVRGEVTVRLRMDEVL
ncbi:right-handed parallel beta-helix repeat-containing protein [Aquicoccus porphyridii]|uniref:Right-handed parallel beta-helix repeat-containing protein n=1 Tax=Aquicoccus porphyridii TaxID=1852029 RepID=A0A5A9Z4I6_9RHOB|nr:glycosyl hydrolase family 28-related protein [Aquicoccus porphyridii]KAA0912080.1 right-handed parallel beta-helix repeat-containing protein [Aquicoccus porphyridii]RAI53065.1 right-handed parallel beta-helix repeat-containing protein [Rhodobacteraceae bacterium AsT-22]